jgi:hypothetical protein
MHIYIYIYIYIYMSRLSHDKCHLSNTGLNFTQTGVRKKSSNSYSKAFTAINKGLSKNHVKFFRQLTILQLSPCTTNCLFACKRIFDGLQKTNFLLNISKNNSVNIIVFIKKQYLLLLLVTFLT